jgi:uncharacterized protein with HEPN domain
MPSMPSRSVAVTLQDILENIRLAQSFVSGMAFTNFTSDQRTSYAVVRCLEIISEATRRLPTELKARHPEIEWSDIAGSGSIYRHQYQAVSTDIIWQTVQDDLEPLRIVTEMELARLRDDGSSSP